MFGQAIGATTQPQRAGGGLADLQVRVRSQPRLDGRCGRQRGRSVPRRRVADVMRRDAPSLDLLVGDRVDEHNVDIVQAQITGRHAGEREGQRVQSRHPLQAPRLVPLHEHRRPTVDSIRIFHVGVLHEGGEILSRHIGQGITPRRWRKLVPWFEPEALLQRAAAVRVQSGHPAYIDLRLRIRPVQTGREPRLRQRPADIEPAVCQPVDRHWCRPCVTRYARPLRDLYPDLSVHRLGAGPHADSQCLDAQRRHGIWPYLKHEPPT